MPEVRSTYFLMCLVLSILCQGPSESTYYIWNGSFACSSELIMYPLSFTRRLQQDLLKTLIFLIPNSDFFIYDSVYSSNYDRCFRYVTTSRNAPSCAFFEAYERELTAIFTHIFLLSTPGIQTFSKNQYIFCFLPTQFQRAICTGAILARSSLPQGTLSIRESRP